MLLKEKLTSHDHKVLRWDRKLFQVMPAYKATINRDKIVLTYSLTFPIRISINRVLCSDFYHSNFFLRIFIISDWKIWSQMHVYNKTINHDFDGPRLLLKMYVTHLMWHATQTIHVSGVTSICKQLQNVFIFSSTCKICIVLILVVIKSRVLYHNCHFCLFIFIYHLMCWKKYYNTI